MKLSIFLQSSGLTGAKLADVLGVSEATVNRYVHGKSVPRSKIMTKIVEFTEGKVQPGDFYENKF